MAVERNAERVIDTALADSDRNGKTVARRGYLEYGRVAIGDEEIAVGIDRNAMRSAAADAQVLSA